MTTKILFSTYAAFYACVCFLICISKTSSFTTSTKFGINVFNNAIYPNRNECIHDINNKKYSHGDFRLYAKTVKKKKSKPKTNSAVGLSGGGFGMSKQKQSKTSTKTKEEDDFAIFPPLDENVKATLVASTETQATQSDELSNEIYDRLAQIYGFPNFNYLDIESDEEIEESDGQDSDTMSFEDMIMASSSPSSSSSSSSSSSLLSSSSSSSSLLGDESGKSLSSDFSDLIASATGDNSDILKPIAERETETNKDTISKKKLSISKLPPFEKFRVLHVDPMVLCIDDFLTPSECDTLIAHSDPTSAKNRMNNPTNIHMAPMMSRSKTVGKDRNSQAQRTSTTWFHHFQGVEIAPLLAKSCRLMGLDNFDQWEEPQTVRYRGTEKFTWHLDALSPSDDLMNKGGQRTATLLVYLNSLENDENDQTDENEIDLGGATMFRDLGVNGEFLKV